MKRMAILASMALALAGAPAVATELRADVIVTGKAHAGIDGLSFDSRSQAIAALASRSAPFFDAVRKVAEQTGSTIREVWPSAPAIHVHATGAMLDRLARMPEVVRVERDSATAVQLSLDTPGVRPLNTGGRQMLQAEDIWDLGYRGEGIKLAVIDTGIDAAHEAFRYADGSTRITGWVDWINDQPAPYDDNGHGTHVAGSAAGSALFDDPVHGFFQEVGVAPAAEILAAKFLSASGSGSFADAISSLNWAFENGADVTSNSWGASCATSVAAIQTVRMLTDLGMLSVFSAGGSGPGAGTVSGPACGESALSVGAVDSNRVIAGSSGRGPCSDPDLGSPPRICPDLVAKGVTVVSAWPRPSSPSGYRTLSGTSMAAPMIAGAAALAEQMKRALTGSGWDTAARAEETVFKQTSLDLGPAGPDNAYGWGLPQLLSIYELLANQDIAVIVPTFGITRPIVFEGETTTLTFAVRNAGGAVATGRFRVTRTAPSGTVAVLRDVNVSLGFLDQERLIDEVEAGPETQPGTYTFRGTFDYTWTDSDGIEHSGSVDRSGTFLVKRVVLQSSLAGFASSALPLVPQHVLFTVANNGNDSATGVVIDVMVPADYLFAPNPVTFDPADLRTLYATPRPDAVIESEDGVTLRYQLEALDPGESFEFTSNLLARSLGTFAIRATTTFEDGSGQSLSHHAEFEQTVALPA